MLLQTPPKQVFSPILPHFFCLSDWRVCLFTFLSILSVLMHLLSLYQSCTNFMTLLNPRNCSTQHQPEEKTDKPSISKALCGWAGTWISIKQAIYINRCTRDLQHNSASSLVGQVLYYDVCCLCHTGRIHSLLMETTKQVVPAAVNNGYWCTRYTGLTLQTFPAIQRLFSSLCWMIDGSQWSAC